MYRKYEANVKFLGFYLGFNDLLWSHESLNCLCGYFSD